MFYTNSRYDSGQYAAMVVLLQNIQRKWNIALIDLWNDAAFNDITTEQRSRYMADSIHLEWWTPYLKRIIITIIS